MIPALSTRVSPTYTDTPCPSPPKFPLHINSGVWEDPWTITAQDSRVYREDTMEEWPDALCVSSMQLLVDKLMELCSPEMVTRVEMSNVRGSAL